MNSFISQLARFMHLTGSDNGASEGVAQNLMERAEAGAGKDPHQAQELRSAACAYLSVIR